MITIKESPNEGAAIVITVRFNDFDKAPFTPNTCLWSLTTSKGLVVNSRDRVPVTVVDSSHNFLIAGDDLLFEEDKGRRVFTVEGTYDSVYGMGVPYREEVSFSCKNMVVNPA
jgi:hypothetical protein